MKLRVFQIPFSAAAEKDVRHAVSECYRPLNSRFLSKFNAFKTQLYSSCQELSNELSQMGVACVEEANEGQNRHGLMLTIFPRAVARLGILTENCSRVIDDILRALTGATNHSNRIIAS